MKTYKVDLSEAGIDKAIKILDNLGILLSDEKLMMYIGEKCKKELNLISINKLSSTYGSQDVDMSNYLSHHKIEIANNYIYLYNDSVVDTSTKNISDTKRANYPLKLSLASIVEYGIGYVGSLTPNDDTGNWAYDVNKHGASGWSYLDTNGNWHHTNGFEGRLIFYNLKLHIEEQIASWLNDYIDKNLKD